MALVETLKTWDSAVNELDQQNVASALTLFKKISEPSSKIVFNIGCCYELLGRLNDAVAALDDAISRDSHFVVAYFQRACVKFQMNRLEEAVEDFDLCYKKMMGKKFIDYGQLGLRYKLHACEPQYNAGVTLLHKKDFMKAMDYILQAQKGKCESRHNAMDQTIDKLNLQFRQSQRSGNYSDVKLIQLPPNAVFRPPKSKVANMNEIQFLKKAKVVAAATENDTFTGFVGRKRLEETGQATLSAPNSPLSPRRNLNKSPTVEAGKKEKARKSASPGPSADRASISSNKAKGPPPSKPLPPPPQKPLPVPPPATASPKGSQPPLPDRAAPALPSKPDVRPKQTTGRSIDSLAGELQSSLAKMNFSNGTKTSNGGRRTLPDTPSRGGKSVNNDAPPIPPKTDSIRGPKNRRSQAARTRESIVKPAAPEPPTVAEAGGFDQYASVNKPDPNLVTIDLNCYSTITIRVDRGTSLQNLLDVAASISEFDLEPGTFNLWCVGPENEQVCLENEDMMKMLWTEKEDDNYIALWCYAKQ